MALTQALRHSAGTWQVWDNYARASAECGELGSACRAIGKVCKLSNGEQGDLEVIEKLVDAVVEGYRRVDANVEF